MRIVEDGRGSEPLCVIPDDLDVDEAADVELLRSELGHNGWYLQRQGWLEVENMSIFHLAATPNQDKALLT